MKEIGANVSGERKVGSLCKPKEGEVVAAGRTKRGGRLS